MTAYIIVIVWSKTIIRNQVNFLQIVAYHFLICQVLTHWYNCFCTGVEPMSFKYEELFDQVMGDRSDIDVDVDESGDSNSQWVI